MSDEVQKLSALPGVTKIQINLHAALLSLMAATLSVGGLGSGFGDGAANPSAITPCSLAIFAQNPYEASWNRPTGVFGAAAMTRPMQPLPLRLSWRIAPIAKNNGDEARQCIPDSYALICRFFPRSILLILLGGCYH